MKWKSIIKLKDLFSEYSDACDELEEVNRIKPILKERLEHYSEVEHFIVTLDEIKTKSGLDKWLDSLYDYCDMNRIWIQ